MSNLILAIRDISNNPITLIFLVPIMCWLLMGLVSYYFESLMSNKKYYWWVNYTFQSGMKRGYGSCKMSTSEDWFPVAGAKNYIKDQIKEETIIINSWIKLNNKQVNDIDTNFEART